MTLVVSPLLIRNLIHFGEPFHSDAASFAVWPFVDPIAFSHDLERPPAPLPFLATHLPQLAEHVAHALARFARSALPRDLVGHPVWIPALTVGLVLALARLRTWGFAALYLAPVVLLMCSVSWNTRYFASTAPFWCLLTALGAVWLARRIGAAHWPRAARAALLMALLVPGALAGRRAWLEVRGYVPEELAAAAAEAPWLAARLGPDEALLAVTTSYWSWFTDRASVHLPIADEAAFMAVMRRYRVRWAALPTSRLGELAARYPGGRLPAALVPDHEDPARDVTVFSVRESPPDAVQGH
jgi:hypothetical protein